MMFFLDVNCGGELVLQIIRFVYKIIDIVKWIIPMGLIVIIMFDFAKSTFAGKGDDMKKNAAIAFKRVLYAMVIFLVEPIVTTAIHLLGNANVEYAECVGIAISDEDLSQYRNSYEIEGSFGGSNIVIPDSARNKGSKKHGASTLKGNDDNSGDAPASNSEVDKSGNKSYRTSKGYTVEIKNGVAYIDGNLIVNKTYSLPSNYKPTNPATAITSDNDKCDSCIEGSVMSAFSEMESAASSAGVNLKIISGYRPYKYQETLYNNYVQQYGKDSADTLSARAGYSEHQTGLCFDLNSLSQDFENTTEGKWLSNNAYKYGFILRYPKGKESVTGYMFEPWHFRYVGNELASKLYNNGNWIALEEHYGITSSY